MSVAGFVITYLSAINLAGFIFMGVDKYKAKRQAFRIPEATLFTLAVFFGSIGSILGMLIFHHKTRKWYFRYGMPAILLIQLILIYLIYRSPVQIIWT